MVQRQETSGNWSYDTTVGELQTSHRRPERSEDSWVQAALTVEGKVANLDLVYAGSYLTRDVDTESDYSDYSYWYDTLVEGYGAYWVGDDGNPIDPTQYIQSRDLYDRYTHEIRVASDAEQRLRFVAGAFVQQQEHDIQQVYKVDGIGDQITVTGWADAIWLTRQLRVDRDWALFGEVTYDFTEKLSGTVGARYFDSDNSLEGFFGYSEGFSSGTGEAACPDGDHTTAPDFNGAPCKVFDKTTKEDGVTPRVNLTYKFSPDAMVYATYSEGFRPGGINRRGTLPPYEADWLTNYEIGWKSTWLDNRLRLNGAVFSQVWDDFQFAIIGLNGLTEVRNAGQAQIDGIEMDVTLQATERFGISAGVAYLDSELKDDFCNFINTDGKPQQSPCINADGDVLPPQAPKGTALPVTPEWKANATARYEFNVANFDSYLQGSVIYMSEREADLRTLVTPTDFDIIDPLPVREVLGQMPSSTVVDFSTGIGKDSWRLELFVQNAFDERSEIGRFSQCQEEICGQQIYVTPQRPRMYGLKFSQEF
jgi:outer membrane receptor protein involved in Fe transport